MANRWMNVPLPPRVDENDYRRIGGLVAVEVAKRDQVVYQSGVHPLRRARVVLH